MTNIYHAALQLRMIHSWYFNDISGRSIFEWVKNTKKKRKSILFALIYTKNYCHYFTWNNPLTYHPSWLVFRHDLLLHRCAFRCAIVAPSVVSLQRSALPTHKSWDNPIASMGLVYLHTWIFQGVPSGWSGVLKPPSLRFKQHPWEDIGIYLPTFNINIRHSRR